MTGRMRIGMCLFGFGGLDLDASFQLAAAAGTRPVSIGIDAAAHEAGGMDALASDPERHGLMLRDKLSVYGLEPIELFMCSIPMDGGVPPTERLPGRRRDALSLFRAIARFAVAAGFQHVMGVPGSGTAGPNGREADWDRAREMLHEMCLISKAAGVGFTVEPHRGSILEKPAFALRMAAEVPGLRYTLDYSHFHAQGIPEEEVYPLHPHALHIHIKQAAIGRGKTLWHEGTVPYDTILGRLAEDTWEGVLSSEYIGAMPKPHAPGLACAADLLSNPLVQNLQIVHYVAVALSRIGPKP